MPYDFRIVVPNRPGTSGSVFDALAAEDINVEGLCGDLRPGEIWGYLHILVEDRDAAAAVLKEGGYDVSSIHKVELLELENRPGALSEALAPIREAGRNIEIIYTTGDGRLVLGTEDMRQPIPGVRTEDATYK